MDVVDYLKTKISIHALRGEGDYAPRVRLMRLTKFQSTPSVGRATGGR